MVLGLPHDSPKSVCLPMLEIMFLDKGTSLRVNRGSEEGVGDLKNGIQMGIKFQQKEAEPKTQISESV